MDESPQAFPGFLEFFYALKIYSLPLRITIQGTFQVLLGLVTFIPGFSNWVHSRERPSLLIGDSQIVCIGVA